MTSADRLTLDGHAGRPEIRGDEQAFNQTIRVPHRASLAAVADPGTILTIHPLWLGSPPIENHERAMAVHPDITRYNDSQADDDRTICAVLAQEIDTALPAAEGEIWHRHPVWFLDGNPIVGYSKLKDGIRHRYAGHAPLADEGVSRYAFRRRPVAAPVRDGPARLVRGVRQIFGAIARTRSGVI
jgi:hypothetical protein